MKFMCLIPNMEWNGIQTIVKYTKRPILTSAYAPRDSRNKHDSIKTSHREQDTFRSKNCETK